MAEQIRLRAAGRRFCQWNLGEEIQSRLRPIHFSAPFGIMGVDETGRRTLALRFAAMEANVLPQEKSQPVYSSFFLRTVRPYDNVPPVGLHLRAFICPTPEGSTSDTLFYLQEWDSFCCIAFLFDITRKETFAAAKAFMMLYSDTPFKHILVGNKCDLRVSVPERNTVARRDAEAEARRRGIKYHECSARTKLNVQSLLNDIQDCALEQKYKMNL